MQGLHIESLIALSARSGVTIQTDISSTCPNEANEALLSRQFGSVDVELARLKLPCEQEMAPVSGAELYELTLLMKIWARIEPSFHARFPSALEQRKFMGVF